MTASQSGIVMPPLPSDNPVQRQPDISLARALGLAGTPVTVIGDSALLGAVSAAELNDRIQKVLSANR